MTINGKPTADGLVAAVQRAHNDIKTMLNDVADSGDQETFDHLAETLAAHEAAEQKIVHPVTRRAAGGDGIATARVDEEREGEQLLEKLKEMGTANPGFEAAFDKLRAAVLEHATHEENDEHPLIEAVLSADDSRRAAEEFRAAQAVSA